MNQRVASRVSKLSVAVVLSMAALAGGPAWAREGVDVGKQSWATRLVPAEDVEQAAQQQYAQMGQEARQKGALLPDNHPQVVRLRAIAQRLIPFSYEWNKRASQWKWEVNVLNSKELNAFCMPGGKIAFYTGILDQLKLTDDEVAMVMGHEIAHALREHARERMGKTSATKLGANLISGLLGLGSTGDALLNMGGQLLTLKFSRENESEADLVGMELAARAGYDPRAGVSLWQKMGAASKGAPPQWLSTHPSGNTRIQEIEANLPKVMPLFDRAAKPAQRYDVPKRSGEAYNNDPYRHLIYWGVAS
ncbi:M48 family metallopeptidase [Aquabacterium sp.]|uniref:M48 family metallopeptidase n=1 Tax=Aquabacterium sp. TaxID=1872578 RepID=UPI002E34ADEE|nr:M48 family metallopeptidase [Aquabacterium sp.]HEX5310999.1 M48 family metallopeptidase [Aquabacterium sp.]